MSATRDVASNGWCAQRIISRGVRVGRAKEKRVIVLRGERKNKTNQMKADQVQEVTINASISNIQQIRERTITSMLQFHFDWICEHDVNANRAYAVTVQACKSQKAYTVHISQIIAIRIKPPIIKI